MGELILSGKKLIVIPSGGGSAVRAGDKLQQPKRVTQE